jgi:hypothetical protein
MNPGAGRVRPLQNRVSPLGELVATPARGAVYGNRGCLHDSNGVIRRGWNGRRWLACRLEFKGWHRAPLLQPGRFTELFFLDEVTAFAAGHRPCALCRGADYDRFGELWQELHPGERGAGVIDARLHEERIDVDTGERRLHSASYDSLPDGAVVLGDDGLPLLVDGDRLWEWSFEGYHVSRPRPGGRAAVVITPPSLVAVLRSGWSPLVPLVGKRHGTAYLEG